MTAATTIEGLSNADVHRHLKIAEEMLLQFGDEGRAIVEYCRTIRSPRQRLPVMAAKAIELNDRQAEAVKYKNGKFPVGVREFITSPNYMDAGKFVWPKVLDEIEEACSGNYVEGVFTGGIGCLGGDTEFLTEGGWVRMADWDGHKVAEYDLETGRIDYVAPLQFIDLPADEWVTVKQPIFGMTVSPEHSVLLKHFKKGFETISGHGLLKSGRSHYQVPSTFTVDFPGVDLTDDEIRLMVAVLADGNFHPGSSGNKCRIVVRRQRKRDRLEALLNKMGLKWNMTGPYTKRPTEVTYWFDAPIKTKDWGWAWACSSDQLRIIHSEVPYWDGLHPDSTPTQEWRFHTTDKAAADFMQYACQAIGRRAAIRVVDRPAPRKAMYYVQARNDDATGYWLSESKAFTTLATEGERKYCFLTGTGYFIARQNGRVFVTGNCAKSTAALYIQAYTVYQLSCLKDPHAEFGLDPASEIMIIFQSLNATVAKAVEYDRFREMLERSPYFKKNFRHDPELKSMIRLPNRIVVKSVSGDASAAIGQNVISGIIDEVNFMAVVEKSKMSADGGVFNQAVELYNSIVRRRESRFMKGDKLPGLLCLVSSARYPGQFTDQRKEAAKREIERTGRTRIYIYDKRQWEVRPEDDGTYSGETFNLFLGDVTRKARVMDEGEVLPDSDQHLVMEVPVEHLHVFEDDIYDAIRDVAGQATLATHPFIPYPEKTARAFGKVNGIFSRSEIDFNELKTLIYPKRFTNLDCYRYVHCDLALTGDSCGFVVGHIPKFVAVERDEGLVEMLPIIRIDGILEIRPPRGGEISLAKVRGLIYKLREMGLPVKWVSYDSFASADSIQVMRQKGYMTGELSMDVTPKPYEMLKQAITDERLECPEHIKCQRELLTLERNPKTGKIDHTAVGSKDISDALAGVAYGLTMRRENWMRHGINPHQIPRSITDVAINYKRSMEDGVGS